MGLQISTGIMGEYQPPPEVNFTKLVQDSVDKHLDILISKLKKNPKFSKVKTISSIFPATTIQQQQQEEPITKTTYPNNNNNNNISSKTLIIIVTSSAIGFILFIICILISIARTISRKQNRAKNVDYFNNNNYDHINNSCDQYTSSIRRLQNVINMRGPSSYDATAAVTNNTNTAAGRMPIQYISRSFNNMMHSLSYHDHNNDYATLSNSQHTSRSQFSRYNNHHDSGFH